MIIEKKLTMGKRKVSLKRYTSFQIGGVADYFIPVKDEKELIMAMEVIKKTGLPFFILGGGSNVLFQGERYRGVVLKIEMRNVSIKNKKTIIAESGASIAKTISFCLAHRLSGLEWAAGIPGTIGGAIRGNAGAFKESMKDSVTSVRVYNIKTGRIKNIKNTECRFDYRESIFKSNEKYIILSAEMRFKEEEPFSINENIKFYINQRKVKQPQGFSAGSVFKNYEIKNKKEKEKILKNHPDIKILDEKMIPAAFLIEKCGLKGKIIGKAMISRIHANFIVNLGGAKSSDVLKLIARIQKEVEKKFGIVLEKEIMIINT